MEKITGAQNFIIAQNFATKWNIFSPKVCLLKKFQQAKI